MMNLAKKQEEERQFMERQKQENRMQKWFGNEHGHSGGRENPPSAKPQTLNRPEQNFPRGGTSQFSRNANSAQGPQKSAPSPHQPKNETRKTKNPSENDHDSSFSDAGNPEIIGTGL